MKERGILFTADMVRAILEGRKTQTRRIMKQQPHSPPFKISCSEWETSQGQFTCPYGIVGDRLWVRETWRGVCSGEIEGGEGALRYGIQYRADNFIRWNERETVMSGGWKDTDKPMQFRDPPWKPGIHLRKGDSRITLEITNVRVQRVQEISREDVNAEGTPGMIGGKYQCDRCNGNGRNHTWPDGCPHCEPKGSGLNHTRHYWALWQSINGPGSWEKNPWVWAITFKKV